MLFNSYQLRTLELKNRVVMAPMCMFCANEDGKTNSFHYVHYVNRAIGGVGLILVEATAVEPRGRITDHDLGLWNDEQIDGLKEIVSEAKKYGAKLGIQLGHAGRKCQASDDVIIAPSPISFTKEDKVPKQMSNEDIIDVINHFQNAALRAVKAGFDLIEIHGAHGYLINQFMSPLTNKRNDEYGGSIENRARLLKEIVIAIRKVIPSDMPLLLRVSAKEYANGGNDVEDVAAIINLVKEFGLDLIDVSTGGVVNTPINVFPGYQIEAATQIKKLTELSVIGGGLITDSDHANEIVVRNQSDFVFIGRELLRNPFWTLHAAKELNQDIEWPNQYSRAK